MTRFSILLTATALVACSGPKSATNTSAVDIDGAAERAQSEIDRYSAGNAPGIAKPVPKLAASTPAPSDNAGDEPYEPPAPGTPGGLPDDRTSISEAPFTPQSAQGAADVVQRYYALIGEGKYHQAWALWDDGGQAAGLSAAAFAARFDRYAQYHANIGAPGSIEAGAGQRRVSVPVQVYGRLKTGEPFHQLGHVTLHRAGDIDGASAEQKTWHISASDVEPPKAVDGGAAPPPGDPQPARIAASYRCTDGFRFIARFDNRAQTATLAQAGRVLAVLIQRRAASGIWYSGHGYTLRGKGNDAQLTRPNGRVETCSAG